MRRFCIAGNWKMHHTPVETEAFLTSLRNLPAPASVDIVIFPSFVCLDRAHAVLLGGSILLGAQTLHDQPKGAFTGEISASMLTAVGCSHVLVGHSERRHLFGETNAILNRKCHAAISAGLTPVLCVGETLSEREADLTLSVVQAQITEGLLGVSSSSPFLIAYEPVWAIGTGKVASPTQAQSVHLFIRNILDSLGYPAKTIQVLYGGSVNAENSPSLLSQPDIDGALVGGASLEVEKFYEIIDRAAQLTVLT